MDETPSQSDLESQCDAGSQADMDAECDVVGSVELLSTQAGRWGNVKQVCFWIKRVTVILFVVWQLFYLFVVNTKIGQDALDDSVYCYGRSTGTDQTWAMFSSPLWRKNEFIYGEIEFGDGSKELIQTNSEPANRMQFFRLGGSRLRKLEETAGRSNSSTYYQDLRKRYGRYLAELWRESHVDDPRLAIRVRVLKRRFWIPAPGEERPSQSKPIELSEENQLVVVVELAEETGEAQ